MMFCFYIKIMIFCLFLRVYVENEEREWCLIYREELRGIKCNFK